MNTLILFSVFDVYVFSVDEAAVTATKLKAKAARGNY